MINRQPKATPMRFSLGSIATTPITIGDKKSPPRANKPAPASYPASRHTNYVNTPDASVIAATIARLQYQRYRSRGGCLNHGTHHRGHSYNSRNTTNMTSGDPYPQWFHCTVSWSYYSLGKATTQYEQWLNDPQYGPSPTQQPSPQERPPYIPRAHDYSSDNSCDARAQTIVQDVHTSPDDPNMQSSTAASL